MKKFLSLVLALVMTMSLVTISAGAKDFTDDDAINYNEAIDVMSAVKVIDGYTDGSFKPQTQLNRGQAAKIICNMVLGPTTASALKADAAPFKDVAACWADPAKAREELGWRAELGIDEMCASSWNWQRQNPNGYPE